MTVLEYIIGGLLLVLAIALIAIIGLQQSKRKSGLGNSIAGTGASESYLTRNKIASKESSYKKITLIIAVVFIVLVLALYIIGSIEPSDDTSAASSAVVESSVASESSETAESSVAAESSEVVEETSEAVAESSETVSE